MTDQTNSQRSFNELEKKIEHLEDLLREKQDSLQEAQETIEAIRTGTVDGIVRITPEGNQIFILKGSDQPYRDLIEEMAEGALLISNDGTIMYCNVGFAKLVDAPLDKIMGRNISDWVSHDAIVPFKEIISNNTSNPEKKIFDIAFKSTGQKLIPVQVSRTKISLGSINTSALIVTDLTKHMEEDVKRYTLDLEKEISQRKKAEEELNHAQAKLQEYAANLEKLVEQRTKQLQEKERLAAIGETAGMVGHDIRNPLQAIVSELYLASQAMKEVPSDRVKTEALESIANVQDQVEYINKIVSDLQDFAKPLKPELKEIDLCDFIASFIHTINIPANISPKLDVQTGLKMKTDPTFIRRSITNLVNNAIQAMPNGGKLEVTGYEKQRHVFICVSDTGVGIPENVKHKLFTPMMTTKAKGQGLGLAVVKRLIEAIGGKVMFESAEGKGTTFTIELPKLKQGLD